MPDTATLVLELELHLERARVIATLLAGRRATAQRNRSWSFDVLTGILVSPYGTSVKLHHLEASLLSVFAESKDRRGSYAALAIAIADNGPRARNNLAILVSRIRARGRREAMEIPIVVERSRGYIFLEELDIAYQ